MPKNSDTLKQFKRYSKFYLNNIQDNDTKICWRVEAVDSISMPGILEINAIEYYANEIEDDIENMGVGSTFKAINKDVVYNLPIPIASIELQNRFVALAEQSDKSKFELQQAIEKVDNLIKSLIQQDNN